MNLGELRDQFVELSGRYDLANIDGSDNGADFFINRGQEYLDNRFVSGASEQIKESILSAGSWILSVSRLRVVDEVWAENSDGAQVKLFRFDYSDLVSKFPKLGDTSQSFPNYYAARTTYGSNDLSLYLLPPPSTDTNLDIKGLFRASTLSSDSDSNFWTDLYPNILIMAAQREIELFHRNTQGITDWENAIQLELSNIEKDYVDAMTSHINQMEG